MIRKTILAGLSVAALMSAASLDTRMSSAAMSGDRDTVKNLLQQKVDVNTAMGDGTTALHWAAYKGDAEMAKMLVQAGADINAKTRIGSMTPLFMAAQAGNAGVIEVLLKAGADVNQTSTTGTTPLMLAAASGNAASVKVLLDKGANINAKEKAWGETPLMFATALNRAEVAKLLVAKGADWKIATKVADLESNKGYDPDAANDTLEDKAKKEAEIKRLEEEAAKDPTKTVARDKAAAGRKKAANMRSAQYMGGMTAMHFAVRDGQLDAVKALVESGVDVNLLSAADKTTPVLESIYNGHFDIANYLIDHGADVKLVNDDGLAPLYATIDQQWANRTWYPPASNAEEQIGYLDLMKKILDKGADPNVRIKKKLWFRRFHDDWIDSPGATAFWRAAQANDLTAMKLLVSYHADPNIPTIHQASALVVAAGYGFEDQLSVIVPDARFEVCKYMVEELHMDVNAKDDFGFTPLHGAAYSGNNELVKYIVAKGGDIHAKSHGWVQAEGQTVYETPAGKGDTVADMANGPRTHGIQHPDTVKLAMELGSENSHNCRSATCLPETNATR